MFEQKPLLWFSHLGLYVFRRTQHRACQCVALQQFFVRSFEQDRPSRTSRSRSHINNMVGNLNHILVMLYQNNRIAVIFKFLYRFLHQKNVVIMQPHTWFVKNVHHIGKRRIYVFCNLAPLCLATRQCANTTVERQIAQSDFFQSSKTFNRIVFYILSQRIFNCFHPRFCVGNRHCTHVGNVFPIDFTRKNSRIQTRAATIGTLPHA